MKKLLFLIPFLTLSFASIAQTSLSGQITDVDTGEELIGGDVIISQNGNFVTGTNTDFDGNYKLRLDPGVYDVKASYVGFPSNKVTGVVVLEGQTNKLDIALGGGIDIEICPMVVYPFRIISKYKTTSGISLYQEQIKISSTKNINTIAGNAPGISFSW